jgi:hypothetical protein
VIFANRYELYRRWEELRIGQRMLTIAAIRSGFSALLDSQIVSMFSQPECFICGDSNHR